MRKYGWGDETAWNYWRTVKHCIRAEAQLHVGFDLLTFVPIFLLGVFILCSSALKLLKVIKL